MRVTVRGKLPQWLLLCALLLGVVGMHHLATAAAMPMAAAETMIVSVDSEAGHGSQHPSDMPVHDTLHLCMAVLCVAGSVLLLGWLMSSTSGVQLADRWTHIQGRPRAPDPPLRPGGRNLLSSLCVLRL